MVMTAWPPSGAAISRTRVLAVVAGEWTDPAIRAACEACDHERAAVLALARARAGEGVPAALVAAIVPGLTDVPIVASLCAIASGDRAAAWLEVLRARRIPEWLVAAPAKATLLHAAWRAGGPRDALVREARRLAHAPATWFAHAVLHRLATELADDNLRALTRFFSAQATRPRAVQAIADVDRALASSPAELVAALPDDVAAVTASGFTVRVGPRTGRNDPCPCGSGLKYKRCCADKHAQVAPSPIPGLSWDEYVTRAADRMTAAEVEALAIRDLGRVELRALVGTPLVHAFRRFATAHLWAKAAAALDALAVHDAAAADDHRDDLIYELLDAGELGLAREQHARLRDPAGAPEFELELALRAPRANARDAHAANRPVDAPDPGDRIDALARAADPLLRSEHAADEIDFACMLLRSVPALGILVARGCTAQHPGDAETLLLAIEEARDELGLPPGDPAWDTFASPRDDELDDDDDELDDDDDDDDDDDAHALRDSLRASTARLDELEHQLAASQRELSGLRDGEPAARHAEGRAIEAARAPAAAARASGEARHRDGESEHAPGAPSTPAARRPSADRAPPDAGIASSGDRPRANAAARPSGERDGERERALRAKVEKLEGLVREGNVERGELRRQLAVAGARARSTAAPAEPPPVASAHEDPGDPIEQRERGIAVPAFGRRVQDAIESVPSAVAAEALRTIGGLAAGDANAWQHVKQAKDMPRQVLMARIGIHHRLLFRRERKALDLIDLVSRENLDATLKRLRLT